MNLKKVQEVSFLISVVCVILGVCLGLASIWGWMNNSQIIGKLTYSLVIIFAAAVYVFRYARKLDLNNNQAIRLIQD